MSSKRIGKTPTSTRSAGSKKQVSSASVVEKKAKIDQLNKAKGKISASSLSLNESKTPSPAIKPRARKPLEDILAEVGVLINKVQPSLKSEPTTTKSSESSSSIPPSKSSVKKSTVNLKQCNGEMIDISPAVIEHYNQEVQAGDGSLSFENESKIPILSEEKQEPEVKITNTTETFEKTVITPNVLDEPTKEEFKTMSFREKRQIMDSDEFQQFFSRSSLVIERALAHDAKQEFDFLKDYTITEDNSGQKEQSKNIFLRSTLYDESLCENHAVTSIDWSYKHEELFLSSYSSLDPTEDNGESSSHDGICLVWNLHMPTRPEFKFYAQSPILQAIFHPSQPTLIIGSTYSGQVLMWDTREKSHPINRTSLSRGHTHPIYALGMTPSVKKMHSCVSLSTDAHLCVWNDCMLDIPTVDLELKDIKEEKKSEITASCFGFPGRDNNSIVIGSDEGNIYKSRLYDNTDSLVFSTCYNAHSGPITSIDFHPIQNDTPKSLSDLFLTSSYDWTIRLWNYKNNSPLLSFESARDYILDVRWSPRNPSMFTAIDGMGNILLYDLNKDMELPIVSIKTPKGEALSRIQWNHEGTRLSVGGNNGKIFLYDLAPELWDINQNDASKFFDSMQNLLVKQQ